MIISKPSWVFRTALAALITAGLAACSASPTPYQVVGEQGGYADQQLETDRYRVTFEGNTATPREVVEDYALYRAAELTLQTGNESFKIVSKDVEPIIGTVRGVSPGIGIGIGGGNVGFGLSTRLGGGSPDYAYVTYLDIIVYEDDVSEDDREAFSAFDVVDRLGPAVTGPPEN